jgi:hypothetical protein
MKKLISKNVKVLLMSAALLLASIQFASANSAQNLNSIADSGVKSEVQADFAKYQKTLDNAKDKFGQNGNESFSSATLGDGIPYSIMTADGNFTFDGYIFPIELDGKTSGIIFAKEINGQWGVFNIKNNLSFDQDVKDVKNLLQKNDDPELIYDPALSIYAVAVHHQSGKDELISMKDDSALGLHKNSPVALTDVQTKIKNVMGERKLQPNNNSVVQAGGSGYAGSNHQLKNISVTASAVILILGMISIIVIRKRRQGMN